MDAIILNKKFLGPYNSPDKIKNRAGVYVVICDAFGMTPVRILDAGNAENIKETLRTEKKKEIFKNFDGKLALKFLVYYEKDNDIRAKLNRKIWKELHPVI
jgi:tagatose-1,6-bisphosphate aldolase